MPQGFKNRQVAAVSGTTAVFTNPMIRGRQYYFWSNTDCYINQGATGTAATSSHTPVKAGQYVPLTANAGVGAATTNDFINVIQDSAAGEACLAELAPA